VSLEKRLNTKKFQGSQRQGGACVFMSQSGGSAGGGAEKTPDDDYSINTACEFVCAAAAKIESEEIEHLKMFCRQ
jgi:hypothetical protein